ncbi:MAG: hypothetical protein AAF602_24890, partial [Myxococcota bacterium]
MFVLVLVAVASGGFLWGRLGRAVWKALYGPDVSRSNLSAIVKFLAGISSMAVVVYVLVVAHAGHWGDCRMANGCEIYVFAAAILAVYLVLAGWFVGACAFGFGGVRKSDAARVEADHGGVEVEVPAQPAWPATLALALWGVAPPLGLVVVAVAHGLRRPPAR